MYGSFVCKTAVSKASPALALTLTLKEAGGDKETSEKTVLKMWHCGQQDDIQGRVRLKVPFYYYFSFFQISFRCFFFFSFFNIHPVFPVSPTR